MLRGAARKVAVPFVLLSVVGWIAFGVGFGIRNFEYKDRADDGSINDDYDSAAKPEFFAHWIFGASAPLLFIVTIIHLFCDGQRFTAFFVFLLMPSFLIGCGGVLLFNGLQIYDYYKIEKEHDEDEVFVSIEDLAQLHFPPRIHGDDSYIVVEFSGAIASGLFYWVYLLLLAFFDARRNADYHVY